MLQFYIFKPKPIHVKRNFVKKKIIKFYLICRRTVQSPTFYQQLVKHLFVARSISQEKRKLFEALTELFLRD